MEDAIVVNNISLSYKTIIRKRSIRSFRFFSGKESKKNIPALRNVSFTVKKGEILGIIGTNGSGKSTMLKMLAGVLSPDSGKIDTLGNSISLLSLGVGFNPDLSGMDNIYLSGMLLGFSEKEIQKKCQEIVEFSELRGAIFRPVKTYSSGMYSKLAFSIAVMLKTDIILIDEVLSVGDIRFRQKSHKKMEELIQDRNTTVIIVSHNMNEIQQLCDRVMWLDKGKIREIGPTALLIKAYKNDLQSDPDQITSLPTPLVKVTADEETIHISWNRIEQALDYRIYRKTCAPKSKWETIQDGYWRTEYKDIPPSKTQKYLYTVRARAKTKNGSVWSEVTPSEPIQLKVSS